MKTTFEHELEGADYNETLHVEVDYTTEEVNYGEDADGNRGELMTFIDDITFVIRNEDQQDVTKHIEETLPDEYELIEVGAWDAAEANVDVE